MSSVLGFCRNFAVTTVPPWKSTPRLNASVPPSENCLPTAETNPASRIKMETAIRGFLMPIQSTWILVKNSNIASVSNTKFLQAGIPLEQPHKDCPRDEHG